MNKKNSSAIILFSLLALCLVFLAAAALFFGAEKINPASAVNGQLKAYEKIILMDIRLPRILLTLICGVLLGGAGAVFQGFFRNPLADAGIMGISSGASLGAVISGFIPVPAAFAFAYFSPVSVFAFAGSLAAGILVLCFSEIVKRQSSVTLLLAGTAIGTFLSSVTSILLILNRNDFRSLITWTMGSFNSKGWTELKMLVIPAFLATAMLILCAKSLNLLGSGEKTALSLGLDPFATKILVLLAGSLASACAACGGGIISFVGLIAPHIMRRLFSSDHYKLIPLSMLGGAILLLISDTLARTLVSPSEIPVGIITSLIGVPFFILVLKKE